LQNTYLPLSPVNTIIELHENKDKQVWQWKMEHAHQHTNLNVNRPKQTKNIMRISI
jgi:hypothetical protein